MESIDTRRLILRQFREEDVEAYRAIYAEDETRKWIGGGVARKAEEIWRATEQSDRSGKRAIAAGSRKAGRGARRRSRAARAQGGRLRPSARLILRVQAADFAWSGRPWTGRLGACHAQPTMPSSS